MEATDQHTRTHENFPGTKPAPSWLCVREPHPAGRWKGLPGTQPEATEAPLTPTCLCTVWLTLTPSGMKTRGLLWLSKVMATQTTMEAGFWQQKVVLTSTGMLSRHFPYTLLFWTLWMAWTVNSFSLDQMTGECEADWSSLPRNCPGQSLSPGGCGQVLALCLLVRPDAQVLLDKILHGSPHDPGLLDQLLDAPGQVSCDLLPDCLDEPGHPDSALGCGCHPVGRWPSVPEPLEHLEHPWPAHHGPQLLQDVTHHFSLCCESLNLRWHVQLDTVFHHLARFLHGFRSNRWLLILSYS